MKPRGTLEDGIRQIPGLKFIEPKINLLVIYSDDYDFEQCSLARPRMDTKSAIKRLDSLLHSD